MTPKDLAARAQVTEEQIREWQRLGLLGPEEDLGAGALERARLLRLAMSRGLTAEAIAEASQREGDILQRFVDFLRPAPGQVGSLEEAAEGTGLDPAFLSRLAVAAGLDEDDLGPEDLEAMGAVRAAREAGMPEAALVQLVRVFADCLGRVADAEIRLFHIYVHDRLRAEGVPPDEVARTTAGMTEALTELLDPAVRYFHRKAFARALREDVLGHLAETLAPAGPTGQMQVAVLFVDLASFTPLTEAMGDEAAVEVLDRFSHIVRNRAQRCDGRVVKQIGDEFMLVFPTAPAAVDYALDLADAALGEQHFPALRMGAHTGAALYREADYVGATVNIAARVAAQAPGGHLLVTRQVAEALVDRPAAWRPMGAQALKGVAEPIELFALSFGGHPDRRTDPVCGMELDRAAAPCRLQQRGEELVFCSQTCRDRFLETSRTRGGSSVDEIDLLPSDPAGLPEAGAPSVVDLADGDRYEIRIGPVAKDLGDETVRLLAYNGSVPGPILRVPEGSEVEVTVHNGGDMADTVHWHGLRLDNRYDGTHQVQHPIPVGGRFTYRLRFPDPGLYWYHPHIREDYGQELGLYGTILVVPADPDYWGPAHRELVLTLDDILLEDGRVAPFSRSHSTFTAMGRFGNVLLVNGEVQPSLTASQGEVVRLYLVDTANTRVFNVGVPGARMKLVGGDSGRRERETFVDSVVLAPSERVVVDVLFEQPGELRLEHRTPERTYELATIRVTDTGVDTGGAERFSELRTDAELAAERERVLPFVDAEPDRVLALVAEMDMGEPEPGTDVVYTCPMHPEVRQDEPGSCPHCGMKLVPESLVPSSAPDAGSGHGHGDGHGYGAGHDHSAPAGIEWEDDMVEMNRMTTPATMRWLIVDQATGARGQDIDWRFRVGDRVKIRIVNEMASDHPMHHPFHFHGAGRFLVLSRDGVMEDNFVWKDTVLVPTGQTVDVLLDVTNPGLWMAHCHIAEHHEGGMMFSFTVDP